MNGKLRVCRKCLPGQNNEETFYEDLSPVSYTHLTLPTT